MPHALRMSDDDADRRLEERIDSWNRELRCCFRVRDGLSLDPRHARIRLAIIHGTFFKGLGLPRKWTTQKTVLMLGYDA